MGSGWLRNVVVFFRWILWLIAFQNVPLLKGRANRDSPQAMGETRRAKQDGRNKTGETRHGQSDMGETRRANQDMGNPTWAKRNGRNKTWAIRHGRNETGETRHGQSDMGETRRANQDRRIKTWAIRHGRNKTGETRHGQSDIGETRRANHNSPQALIRPWSRNNFGNLRMKWVYRRNTNFLRYKQLQKSTGFTNIPRHLVIMRESRRANHSRWIMLEKPGLHIAVKSAVSSIKLLANHQRS